MIYDLLKDIKTIANANIKRNALKLQQKEMVNLVDQAYKQIHHGDEVRGHNKFQSGRSARKPI